MVDIFLNRIILFKVLDIQGYKGVTQIACRVCVCERANILNDQIGRPLVDVKLLDGTRLQDTIFFNQQSKFEFDYNLIRTTMIPDDIRTVVVYCSFYNEEEQGYQIGWLTVPLFRMESGQIVVNNGKFVVNLISPPTQRPPFNLPTKITQIFCDFIIREETCNEDSLHSYDFSQFPEEDPGEKRLHIELISLNNQEVKGELYFYTAIMSQGVVLKDRKTVPCENKGLLVVDSIEAEERDAKTRKVINPRQIYFFHEDEYNLTDVTLRQLIRPEYRPEANVYVEVQNEQGGAEGLAKIPLFRADNKKLNKGQHLVNLELGDDILEAELVVRIGIEEEHRFENKEYDADKGLLVNIEQITNFRENFDAKISVFVIDKDKIMKDMDENPAVFQSQKTHEREQAKKKIDISEGIEMPINWKKIRDENLRKVRLMKNIGILIEFYKVVDNKVTRRASTPSHAVTRRRTLSRAVAHRRRLSHAVARTARPRR